MSTMSGTALVSKPALRSGRAFSGLVILLMVDSGLRLAPWSVIAQTMDRMGNGSSESFMRALGLMTVACTLLYAVPPTSIVGAILLTGYLGGAVVSHLQVGSPQFTCMLFGFYLGVMLWACLWLRDRSPRDLIS